MTIGNESDANERNKGVIIYLFLQMNPVTILWLNFIYITHAALEKWHIVLYFRIQPHREVRVIMAIGFRG